MSLATALLTPILGDASPWTPRRLFQLGEAGGVYDPSDLTAEKVAWRRNLLTWSQDFDNAAWLKTNTTVTAGVASWNGTLTASTLVENTVNGTHTLVQQVPVKPRVNPTVSFVAKAAGRDWVRIAPFPATPNDFTNNPVAYIDLSNGTVGTTTRCTVTVTPRGSGWYFCAVTATQFDVSTSTTTTFQIGLASADNTTSYLGDGVSGITFADMQYEAGPATAYQRITDFTSDFLAAFPTHGLYQDAAGTTPVTALGQPVGLVIDSKTGGLANLGPETVVNGAFDNALTGWTAGANATLTVVASFAGRTNVASTVNNFTSGVSNTQTITGLTAGRMYIVSFDVYSPSSNVRVNAGSLWVTETAAARSVPTAEDVWQRRQFVFTAASTSTLLSFNADAPASGLTVGDQAYFDNISVREVPGVHAIQATSSSRPLLDGRVNLFTFSEQFDNAAWVKAGVSVTANNAVAPDGTTTADRYVESALNEVHSLGVANVAATNGATYILSAYGKDAGRFLRLILPAGTFGTAVSANFDLVNGVAYDTAGTGATIENVGSGWFRCSIRVTATTSAVGSVSISSAVTSSGTGSYAGDGTSGIFIWGADLRLATDAAYPYQRVAAATDYADVGVPRAFAFDGFDDSLYTASNMDLSGTDKVTVLAGVRKLSDAAIGVLCETSAAADVTNGAFAAYAPLSAAAANYALVARGTGARTASYTNAAVAAPNTSVLTGLADIAAPLTTLRVNAAQVATNASTLGTGNFGSHVLFIGRRNNASLPFNGKAYQLIVRGALTDAATLAQAERYVGAKTGIFL